MSSSDGVRAGVRRNVETVCLAGHARCGHCTGRRRGSVRRRRWPDVSGTPASNPRGDWNIDRRGSCRCGAVSKGRHRQRHEGAPAVPSVRAPIVDDDRAREGSNASHVQEPKVGRQLTRRRPAAAACRAQPPPSGWPGPAGRPPSHPAANAGRTSGPRPVRG